MSVAFKVTYQWEDTKAVHVTGSLVFSGNYPTGGDTINFGALSADTYPVSIKTQSGPLWLEVQSNAGYNFFGFDPTPAFTPPATAKIQAFNDNGGAELAAGAYPAALVNGNTLFRAIFPKHI